MQYTKKITYDRYSKDYAMELNGEIVGYAKTHLTAEATLDELVYDLIQADAAREEAYLESLVTVEAELVVEAYEPTTEELACIDNAAAVLASVASDQVVIVAPLTPAITEVDAVLARYERDAERESAHADKRGDGPAFLFAEGQRKAMQRARRALALASQGRKTLAVETVSGDWLINGSKGDLHTVSLHGPAMSCSCPHGKRLARGEPASGACWHGPLVSALIEGQDMAAMGRDLATMDRAA